MQLAAVGHLAVAVLTGNQGAFLLLGGKGECALAAADQLVDLGMLWKRVNAIGGLARPPPVDNGA